MSHTHYNPKKAQRMRERHRTILKHNDELMQKCMFPKAKTDNSNLDFTKYRKKKMNGPAELKQRTEIGRLNMVGALHSTNTLQSNLKSE